MTVLKKVLIIIISIIVLATVMIAMQPVPVSVEVASVEPRDFYTAVEEQGRTRTRQPYMVAAPVNGRLLRIEFDEGDVVEQGQVLARIAVSPDDKRDEEISRANLVAIEARYIAEEAALMEAESTYDRAVREEDRRGELFKDNLVSSEEREYYRQLVDAAEAKLLTAQASLQAADAEVERAKAFLLGVNLDDEKAIQGILSPINGKVYRVYEESERVVIAGTALLGLSDGVLEVIVDLLTQDAVKVSVGDEILISGWGGENIIHGMVSYIEPEAFTKYSALGVEEQRVNVIGEFVEAPDALGAEYRIEAAIVVWKGKNVLAVPNSAIFQRANGWNSFVINDDKVTLRNLEIGHRGREYAEVLDGLEKGEKVVLFPSDLIAEGVKITF